MAESVGFFDAVAGAKRYLEEHGRVSLRGLKREFALDDEALADLVEELVSVQEVALREEGSLALARAPRARASPPPQSPRDPSATAPSRAPDHLSRADRRQLTVMFIDLVGSTALSEELDPEELVAILEAYQGTCRRVLDTWNGFVARPLGDGVLAYFGYPQALEDAPSRSIRAGLEIVQSMPQLSAELEARHPSLARHPLQVRIGIDTGLVVVGDVASAGTPEQVAIGETPNVAARLQGVAKPNEVIISEATLELVPGIFLTEDRGVPKLKGINERIHAYRVLRTSGVHSRLERRGDRLTPLVGRQSELDDLRGHWRAARQGAGRAIQLCGEPGVGKSRLVYAFRRQLARESHAWIECHCNSVTIGSAFFPLIELLNSLLGSPDEDSSDAQLARLRDAIESLRLPVSEALPALASLLSLEYPEPVPRLSASPSQLRSRTMEVIAQWLIAVAERQPLVVLVEDLHWSDASTLEFLEMFLPRAAGSAVLILLTFRPEFEPPWAPELCAAQLDLDRLRREDAEDLIARMTPGSSISDSARERILEHADGVPLFLEELTKVVLETSPVERKASGEFAIPATLQGSLMARLDRLGEAKEVAQLAAILGREFSHDLISAVSPFPSDELDRGLDRLIESGFLYERNRRPHARYQFKHALVHDVAYQSLLKRTRAEHHQKVAEVLEERFRNLRRVQPELVAMHFSESSERERAIPYLEEAGVSALGRSAHAEAVRHLTMGLALLEEQPETKQRKEQELRLQLPLATAYLMSRGYGVPEVAAAYERARELCRQLGDTPDLIPVLLGMFRYYMARAEYGTAQSIGGQLVKLAEHTQVSGDRILAHYALGSALHLLGEAEPTLQHMDEAIRHYDPDSHRDLAVRAGIDPAVTSHSVACHALWELGYADRAVERRRNAMARAEELDHPPSEVFALLWSGAKLSVFFREAGETQGWAERAAEICEKHDLAFFLAISTLLRGWALAEQGRATEGVGEIDASLASLERQGSRLFGTTWLALRAEALVRAERAGEAEKAVIEALQIVEKSGERYWEPELHRILGTLALRTDHFGNPDRAEVHFRRAIDAAQTLGARAWKLRAATGLARLWQRTGRPDRALRLLAPVYDEFEEGFDFRDLKDARELLDSLGVAPHARSDLGHSTRSRGK